MYYLQQGIYTQLEQNARPMIVLPSLDPCVTLHAKNLARIESVSRYEILLVEDTDIKKKKKNTACMVLYNTKGFAMLVIASSNFCRQMSRHVESQVVSKHSVETSIWFQVKCEMDKN